MNKNVLRTLSYGVYAISSLDGTRNTGCIANSIMQITSSPATVAVSMNHQNFTHSCIEKTGKFAVSILSESSSPAIIGQFGFQSGKDTDKFDGVSFEMKEGLPVLTDCCGYLVCKVIDKMETSTHTVFLGEVIDGDVMENAPAMTYAYYHNVIKGKSPKNAPTYLAEDAPKAFGSASKESDGTASTESNASNWVCSVCGYVYDGEIPFEELPDTYVCPICKQPKDKFVK